MTDGVVPEDQTKKSDPKEFYRFVVATIIIAGVLVILGISVLKNTPDPTVLAAAFGGWILAIVTFYFAGQSIDSAQKNALQSATIAAGATEAADGNLAKVKALKDKQTNAVKDQTDAIQELMVQKAPASMPDRAKSLGVDFVGEPYEGEQPNLSELKRKLQKINDQLQESSDDFDKDYKLIEDRISQYRSRLRNP